MKHFITFGDTTNYKNSLNRIETEVKNMHYFDKYVIYNETKIPDFMEYHKEFMRISKRGFGYWIWKPYIINEYLKNMDDNDILLYCDSGCHFNINEKSLRRLNEYFEILSNSEEGILSFQLKHKEKIWTKMEVYQFLEMVVDETCQLMATVMLIKKNAHSINIFEKICHLIETKKYFLFDDTPSSFPNDNSFSDHRHDQSILSLLRKKYGSVILEDETWFHNWVDGKNYPIHAKRMK